MVWIIFLSLSRTTLNVRDTQTIFKIQKRCIKINYFSTESYYIISIYLILYDVNDLILPLWKLDRFCQLSAPY